MSITWLFVIVYAVAWPVGLRVLRRLRRQSNLVVTMFTGGLFGGINYIVPGMVHERLLADNPTISMAAVFGLRTLLHSLVLVGFYDRQRGRGARQDGRWRILLLGGLFFAGVGLGIEGVVFSTDHWDPSDLTVAADELRELIPF
jgi:drug/metabolite transporter (DMT)-like permease